MTPRPRGDKKNRGLVHRAADALRIGPLHTLDLARDVLRIEGHPGAASAAVFALLGADDRFVVDASGTWTLSPRADALGRSLADLSYAVVDVETTGGGFRTGHRMTEIAIIEVSKGMVSDEWSTLLNPGRLIPHSIQGLTGISNAMVRDAPYFEHVAEAVRERLDGRVFVAHNVMFDWRFVADELGEAGLGVRPPGRLCTVKLARALLPGLRRRNLDALALHYGIKIQNRHRAYGDAFATARILIRLLDEALGMGIGDLTALEKHVRRSRRKRRARAAAQRELLSEITAPRRGEGDSRGDVADASSSGEERTPAGDDDRQTKGRGDA